MRNIVDLGLDNIGGREVEAVRGDIPEADREIDTGTKKRNEEEVEVALARIADDHGQESATIVTEANHAVRADTVITKNEGENVPLAALHDHLVDHDHQLTGLDVPDDQGAAIIEMNLS